MFQKDSTNGTKQLQLEPNHGGYMSSAANLNEFQEQVRARYDELSKRLQQVARYVLDNTNSVAFDTVAVIAKEADVPHQH